MNLAVKELSVASIISCLPDGLCYLYFLVTATMEQKDKNRIGRRKKEGGKKRKVHFAENRYSRRDIILIKNIIGVKN